MNDGPSTPPGWVPPPGPSPFDQGYGAPFGPPGYGPGFVPLPPRRPKRFGWGAVIAAFVLGGVVASVALIALVVLVAVNDDGPGASTHQRIGEQAAEVGD